MPQFKCNLNTPKIFVNFVILSLFALSLGACGGGSGGGSSSATTYTYATTSTKGDYAEWTINGNQLTAKWEVIQTDGSVGYTLNFNSTCGAADGYGVHNCTVDVASSTCTDGTATCPGAFTGSFDMVESPGVALFVHTGTSGSNSQLNIGFAKDSSGCSVDVSGDYTAIHTGLGDSNTFTIFRADSNLLNVIHEGFGFETPDQNKTSQTVVYTTAIDSETLGDGGCSAGVRTRVLGSGGNARAMITASGLWVLDEPSGQGGMVAFRTDKAASLVDFANKQFNGISFPDNSDPQAISATSGSLTNGKVALAAKISDGTTLSASVETLASAATIANPTYPDFTVAPSGYSSTTLATNYPTPAVIPGLFKLDELSINDGRVILSAMNYNGKLIVVGMVYNYRYHLDTNPATGNLFDHDGLYNTGNFILFEK